MAGLEVLSLDLVEFVLLYFAIVMAFLSFFPLVEYTFLYLDERRSTKQQLAQIDSHQSDGSHADQERS